MKKIILCLLLLFVGFIVKGQTQGVTVITHGFQLNGSPTDDIPSWVLEHAQTIRSRAGGGMIYKNNPLTGQWEQVGGGDATKEIILCYNWVFASGRTNVGIPAPSNYVGNVSASADHLFGLLHAIPNKSVDFILNVPKHFIGHSRGGILMVELANHFLKKYPSISIEHLTTLDPHPAIPMGDIYLSYVEPDGDRFKLRIPSNVQKADNYYRTDLDYEFGVDFAAFDGIPVVGSQSVLLNNSVIDSWFPNSGGAHSKVHAWYYFTEDFGFNPTYDGYGIPTDWYNNSNYYAVSAFGTESREQAGFNHSRIGGGYASMQNVPSSLKLNSYYSPPALFNGNFIYKTVGWDYNSGQSPELANSVNIQDEQLALKFTSDIASYKKRRVRHANFLFPTDKNSLKFKASVLMNNALAYPFLKISYYNAKGLLIKSSTKLINMSTAQFVTVAIPPTLIGQVGTFEFEFADSPVSNIYSSEGTTIFVDDIEFSLENIVISPPVIAANRTNISGGQYATLSATGCINGTIHWSNQMSGQSITVNPIETTGYSAFCEQEGYYSTPSNAIAITVNYTHHLASSEYFIDADPGFGLANPLNITTGGGTVNQTLAIDMAPHNLSQGVHTISFRVKDDNNNWSLTHTKTFLVLGLQSGVGSAIADVEYFIDSLKQDKSNLISTGISANNSQQINVAVPQNVPQGVHTVSFRVKDNQGKYSLFHTKTYLVLGSGLGGNTLSKIEYFFDTDPGFGSGTQVDYAAAAGATQLIDIDVSSLSAGVHVLNVRVKNAANQWSLTHAKVFLVMPDLGGTSTVSRIEYFIGDEDPGPGFASNVAFTPNPDGRNVIASFDLDVSSYPDGDLRLNFRVKDSAGRWSSIVAQTVIKQGSVEILKIEADIYPNHYDVVQQSTVHRYYQLKNGNDQTPLEGAKVKYSVGGQTEVFESSLSDSKGIVDLSVKTGGDDITSTSDDIIPINQTAPVSFSSVVKNEKDLIIKSSQFSTNDFTIKPFSRLVNPKIEYGFAGGFQGGIGVGAKAGFKIGTIEFEASKASAAIGAKQGLDLTITPWSSDPNKMEVSVAYMPGFFIEGTLGPKVEADLSKIVTVEGGIYLEGEVSRSLRQEFRYTLDLNNKPDLFRTAYYILLLKSIEYPNALRAANFFKRLSGFDFSSYDPPIVMSGIATEASLSANAGIGIDAAFFKKGSIEPRVGLGVEFSGGGTLGLENYKVIENNSNNTEHITKASASYDISGTWGPALTLIDNLEQDEPPSVSSSLSFADFLSHGGHYSFGINRKFSGTTPTEVSFDVSSSKEVTLDGESFTKEIVNNYSFDGLLVNNIIQKAKSNTLFSVGNSLTNLVAYNRLNPISIFNSASNNNNFVKSLSGFAKEATASLVSTAFNSAIKNSSEKSLYNTFEGEIPFEIALGLDIQFKVNASAYTKYTYSKREDVYIPSLGKYLTTYELPDSDLNMNLPYQNPADIIMVAATQKVGEVASSVRESAAEFINKFQASVSTLFNKIFTNDGATQMSLSAQTIHDFKSNKTNSKDGINSTNSPTILTIDVPSAPTAFTENTDLRFSYYYPENLLKAKIGVDTFQIITDVFYLNAYENTQRLSTAPNGNFNINTQFSTFDLERSGLPLNSTVKLVFLPLDSSQWEIIGDVNTLIPFNRLGVYAVAAKLLTDNVNPVINVQYPPVVASGDMIVSFTENESGINWSKTTLFVNGQRYSFTRIQNQLAFVIAFSTIDIPVSGIYNIEVFTSDNAGNLSYYKHIYPCEGGISISSVPQLTPYKYSGNGVIEINAGNLIGTDVELQSTKAIILTPGFEAKNGKSFTAQIGGCQE